MSESSNDQEKLSIRGPGGLWLEARGRELIIVLLILLAFTFSAYLIYQHARESLEHDTNLSANQLAIQATMVELVYVTQRCAVSREECIKLNIEMPDSLRKKLKRDDG